MMDDDGDTFSSWRQISIYLNTYIYIWYIYIFYLGININMKQQQRSNLHSFSNLTRNLRVMKDQKPKLEVYATPSTCSPICHWGPHVFGQEQTAIFASVQLIAKEPDKNNRNPWRHGVGTCQVRKLNKTNLVKHGFHTFLRCWGLDGKLGKNKPPLCKILADLGVSKFQIFDFQGGPSTA